MVLSIDSVSGRNDRSECASKKMGVSCKCLYDSKIKIKLNKPPQINGIRQPKLIICAQVSVPSSQFINKIKKIKDSTQPDKTVPQPMPIWRVGRCSVTYAQTLGMIPPMARLWITRAMIKTMGAMKPIWLYCGNNPMDKVNIVTPSMLMNNAGLRPLVSP